MSTIDNYLPKNFSKEKAVTYIEPFIGGGAVLFYLLQKYPNIKRAVINDINPHLINVYKVIKEKPIELIDFLKDVDSRYKSIKDHEERKNFYLENRDIFNQQSISKIEEAGLMIFLNRTCFNGLYRENSKGMFNVPFGRYDNPTICDEALILADSELLQKVEIHLGDFSSTMELITGPTFFYFDPPYRPLSATSSFNSYVKEAFDDSEQIRLKDFYSLLSREGHLCLLSNSDGRGSKGNDTFFDVLYKDFYIERINAKRCINSNPSKRGLLTELLIRNYADYQGPTYPRV